jgi:hypothetical protein
MKSCPLASASKPSAMWPASTGTTSAMC